MVTKREMSRYSSKPPPSWAKKDDLQSLLEQGRPENIDQAVANQTPGFSVAPPFRPATSVAGMMNPNTLWPTSWNGAPNSPRMPDVRPRLSPVEQIMQQLQSMMSGQQVSLPRFNPVQLPQFDPNRFKNQATQSVNEQFNPIINEILNQQRATQGRATTNKRTVGSLYNQLAGLERGEAVQAGRQYDAAQAGSKKLYEDERNRIAAGYAADAASQRAVAKRLGIESLGMGTEAEIAQQSADKNFAQQMNSQQMQSTQGALEQQQLSEENYDRSIANATQAEGIEAQSDIARQLEDYMMQSNAGLAETRAQRAGSIQDLMMKLAEATYQRDVSNAQFGYQQQRDYIGDQQGLYDRQLDLKMQQLKMAQDLAGAMGQGAGEEKLNPWQEAATFAEQLRPGQGSSIIAAIQGAMFERPEIFAREREEAPMNPALFAKLVAQSQSAGSVDRNSLMQVAQIIYKLLYGT